MIADPQGAAIGIFKPAQAMNQHDVAKDDEVCWRELMTSDSTAGFEFYSKLFGWQVLQDMDMGPQGTYCIYGSGETRASMLTHRP